MLKEITIIFSLLMIASFANPFYEFKNSAKGQENGTTGNQNNSNPEDEKVFIQVDDLTTSMSPQGMIQIDGAVMNNNTFDMRDIEITGELFDEDGNSLGTFNKYVTHPSFLLKPDETHTFTLMEVVSYYRLADTNITAFGAPAN